MEIEKVCLNEENFELFIRNFVLGYDFFHKNKIKLILAYCEERICFSAEDAHVFFDTFSILSENKIELKVLKFSKDFSNYTIEYIETLDLFSFAPLLKYSILNKKRTFSSFFVKEDDFLCTINSLFFRSENKLETIIKAFM
jgi:hypothetical protein